MFKGKELKKLARKLLVLLDEFESARDVEDRKRVYSELIDIFDEVWKKLGGLEKKIVLAKLRSGLRKMI